MKKDEKGEDLPNVYELRPLLFPALPNDSSINPTSPAALARSLRCAEPFENHLFLGSTDGNVFCFIQPGLNDEDENTIVNSSFEGIGGGQYLQQDFRHVGTRNISSKPIERILIISTLRIAAVLSESTITFHELPSFLPIPQQVLPHIKGVATLTLDDEQMNGILDEEGLINLCIIKRKVIMLVKMSKDTWRIVKEIPLPGGATNAKRFGDWLCISTTSEYNIVNLKGATLSSVGLPISQTSESPSASCRPSILSIPNQNQDKCEFLITSHSEELTLGVFISQEGEPTARLIEWPSHPRALMIEYPYLHALLRNDTIEVHNLINMEKEQIVHLPPLLEPRTLSNSASFIEFRQAAADMGMSTTNVRLEKGGKRVRNERKTDSNSQTQSLQELRSKSRVLMIGKNVVQGMFKTRVLDSAIRAIHRRDYERAEKLTEQAWKQGESFDKQSFEYMELLYLNQMLTMASLQRLRFEDAKKYIIRGEINPKLILSLFPTISDQIDHIKDVQIDTFTNVADILDDLNNLDDWPKKNLILNYCPPLDIESNETLIKLKDAMTKRINNLYQTLLDEYRTDTSLQSDNDLQQILDTSYALNLIRNSESEALSSFLSKPNQCLMDSIEPQLSNVGCYASLIRIYEDRQEWSSALQLHVKLLDGELSDPTYSGTTQNVSVILNRCEDSQLIQEYGIWLIQHDAASGVKILTKSQSNVVGTNGSKSEDEILDELGKLDEKAAMAFLEAISLTRKQQDIKAHSRLFRTLIDKIRIALNVEEEKQAMQQITNDFVEGAFAESFVSHLALHAESSITVTNRLKLMALLQASTVLNIEDIKQELEQIPLLAYERAIILGKQKDDKAALELLAITLRDANSAETYCSQDRKPLSLMALQSIDLSELKVYYTFVSKMIKRKPATFSKSDQLKLIKILLAVYMEKSIGNEFQVATQHLLNTQAMFLSPKEILALVPIHWTIQMLENFLSRSIRREIHRSNEGHIQRSISLAQNLEIAENLWSKRRGLGGVIEDGTEEEGEGEGMDDIGRALVEKVEGQEKLKDLNIDSSSFEEIANNKE